MGKSKSLSRAIAIHLWVGIFVVLLLVGGLGSWAATTKFAGAVISSSVLVVNSNIKKVQHPTGGIVGQLFVRDGDRVKAADILVRLDSTQIGANLKILSKRLDQLLAQGARGLSERNGADQIVFPESLTSRSDEPDVARLIAAQRTLFETRRKARDGQKEQLRERIAQSHEEIRGLVVQRDAKAAEIEWIRKEVEGVTKLWKQKLIPLTRVAAVQRDLSRAEGNHGKLAAAIAQVKAKIAETELQILQIDQDLRAEVDKEIADARATMAELVQKKVAAEDQLTRLEIRAPQDGVVHELTVHTVGGVIAAGEPIMMIVPANDRLDVEARVAPNMIDRVRLGQPAKLRFSSFDLTATPELFGVVSRISPDIIRDPKTDSNYYLVRITIPSNEAARLGQKLVPGMPVESFIQTDERTVASFLVKPLSNQIARAFRER